MLRCPMSIAVTLCLRVKTPPRWPMLRMACVTFRARVSRHRASASRHLSLYCCAVINNPTVAECFYSKTLFDCKTVGGTCDPNKGGAGIAGCSAGSLACSPSFVDGVCSGAGEICNGGVCTKPTPPPCSPACQSGYTCVDRSCRAAPTVCIPACGANMVCEAGAVGSNSGVCKPVRQQRFFAARRLMPSPGRMRTQLSHWRVRGAEKVCQRHLCADSGRRVSVGRCRPPITRAHAVQMLDCIPDRHLPERRHVSNGRLVRCRDALRVVIARVGRVALARNRCQFARQHWSTDRAQPANRATMVFASNHGECVLYDCG